MMCDESSMTWLYSAWDSGRGDTQMFHVKHLKGQTPLRRRGDLRYFNQGYLAETTKRSCLNVRSTESNLWSRWKIWCCGAPIGEFDSPMFHVKHRWGPISPLDVEMTQWCRHEELK